MIASILIIVVSVALLVYWFRYTCLLLLEARPTTDYAAGLAKANGLHFPAVDSPSVDAASDLTLAELERALARDYRLITYLWRHTAALNVTGVSLEQRLLMFDFRLMQAVCFITRGLALPRARAAVLEMARIVSRLAQEMGERLNTTSAA